MGPPVPGEVTELLLRWRSGDSAALDKLMPMVYEELRLIAGRYLRRERPDHTLQSTALVHEAYMRLVDQTRIQWQGRAHFYGVAAGIIRNILVDHARARQTGKRGSGAPLLSLEEAVAAPGQRSVDVVALDDTLLSLEKVDPQQSRIVELRFFAGLTIEETAEVLHLSVSTVKRDWLTAKTWIFSVLMGKDNAPGTGHDG